MDRRGNLVYLTPYEQRQTGYSSPINLDDFDLHAERQAADAEVDRLEDEQSRIIDDGFGTGSFKSEYEKAFAKSALNREIGKSLAKETLLSDDGLEQGVSTVEDFLKGSQP